MTTAKKHKNYRELDGSVILYPENYINDIEGEKLEDLCESFIKNGHKRIIIDFSNTDMINSIGVSIIIGIIEKIKVKKDVTILFSGLKQVNYQIFNIVGLTKHIHICKDEQEALESIKNLEANANMA